MQPTDHPARRGVPALVLAAMALQVFAAGMLAATPASADDVNGLKPFTARFSVEWKGINAGTSVIELKDLGDGRYSYSSGNQARGLFKLAFPDTIRQSSMLRIEDGTVRPLSFRADDGSRSTDRDVTLTFDWPRNRLTGVSENKPVSLELRPGLQDAMSSQLSLMLDLLAGRAPTGFWMADKDQIKEYVYQRDGEAQLATPAGNLRTVIWSSHRPNSDRLTRVWYAPSLGYVPVQASRTRGGKLEWTMRLQSLARPPQR